MKKKKLLLPIMMSALCVGAGIAGSVTYANNVDNAPGIVQTTNQAEDTNEAANYKFEVHRMNAVNTNSEDSGSTTNSTSTKEQTKDEIAASAVDSLIEAIGEVTVESRDAIKAAKAGYEDLTYKQQKLVENTKDLEDAIREYNKLIKDDEDVKPIAELEHKTILTEPMEEHKGLKTTLIVLGTITGLGIFYLAYIGIKKLIKFFKKC